MASITRCWKNRGLEKAVCWFFCAWFGLTVGVARADNLTEITQFRAERQEEDILVSAQMVFELPSAVEDALLKGIPMFFVAEVEMLRDRWYWYDKRVAATQRNMRLAYQPLTRMWRLNVTPGGSSGNSQGLTLNQSFDTLGQALAMIKRVSRWKVADATDLDGGAKHRVEFRFKLDLSQLPRPFQIGALGQTGWDISASLNLPLILESSK